MKITKQFQDTNSEDAYKLLNDFITDYNINDYEVVGYHVQDTSGRVSILITYDIFNIRDSGELDGST